MPGPGHSTEGLQYYLRAATAVTQTIWSGLGGTLGEVRRKNLQAPAPAPAAAAAGAGAADRE